ncbi:MAG: hypothetical protein MR016_03395 [Agathobacter sp.]|nr:hypothetical protein [Agathobacter sp.]
MRKEKLLAILAAGTMVLSMTACGGEATGDTQTSADPGTEVSTESEAPAETQTEESETPEEPVAEEGPVSVDFEDGLFGFAGVDKTVNPSSDDATIEVASYNGSQALKVTSTQGKAVYVAIQADAMLGDSISSLSTVEMSIGIENPDGTFQSASGNIYGLVGENNDQTSEAWSVYLETANPKTVSYTVPDGYTFGAGNYIVVSLETDTGKDNGATPAVMYIDNIAFKDASGNVLTADTSAEFVAASTGDDRSNLFAISGAVDVPGFSVSGDGWSQAGIDLDEASLAALQPGSVIEISYSSESGNMWLVFPGAEAGWMRVGVGDCDGSGQGYSYYNGSKNIAQVDYDTIAQYLGDDVSKWGTTLQCESDSAFEVYSVKIGQKAQNLVVNGGVELEGFNVSGDGWAQNGVDMTEDFIAALVPGSAIEISYTSETGEIWLVFPGSEAGWMRIGVGDFDGSGQGYGVFDGSKCYITYETIAQYLGEDTSKWGTTLQCEATSAWEVYSVKVGKASEMVANNRQVEIPGFSVSGDGWAQNGVDLDEASLAALQPGCVININYTSETGEIWLVFPGSEAGWMRIGVGDFDGSGQGYAAYDGSHAQITYDTIAQYLGEDTSKWGTTLQCEATSAWEVYSVTIGQQ